MKNKNKPLLMEVNRIFKTIGYDYSHGFDVDNFYKAAVNTLNRCEKVKDAGIIFSCILQFQKLYDEFYQLILDPECLKFFLDLSLVPLKINLLETPDETSYWVSNAFTPDHRKFFVTNFLLDDNYLSYTSSFKEIKGYQYNLKIDNKIVMIFDKNDNTILKIKIDGHFLHFMSNNSDYEISYDRHCINLYRKEILKAKKKFKITNNESRVATFEYLKVKHPNQLGVVHYNLFDENADKELLNLIAISYLILLRK